MSNHPTPENVQDYLNRQQQSAAMQAHFNALPKAEHDEVGAVRRGLDGAAEELADQSVSLVSSFNTTVKDLHAIRRQIADGEADPQELATEVSKIRNRLVSLRRSASAMTARAESLKARRDDPETYAASLTEKYPALRRS